MEHHLPAWLRPACRGAAVVLGLGLGVAGRVYALAVLLTLAVMVGPWLGMALFAGLLSVTLVAGAVGGALHGILRPLDRWGCVGTWVRWFAALFGAGIVAGVVTPATPFSLWDRALHVTAAGIAALGAGVLLLLDDRRLGRPSPRQYQRLTNRDRLWAAAYRARERHQGAPRPISVPSTEARR